MVKSFVAGDTCHVVLRSQAQTHTHTLYMHPVHQESKHSIKSTALIEQLLTDLRIKIIQIFHKQGSLSHLTWEETYFPT